MTLSIGSKDRSINTKQVIKVAKMDEHALENFYHKLDRSFFVNDPYKSSAAVDLPLPIGHGQTISQPSLVLAMTHWLSPELDSKVLEIGTGSGYQTALLAEFSKEVYTVELISELSAMAKERLASLGYKNIFYKIGDGSKGWPDHAPYDRIMVTAAAGRRPQELIDQLAMNGRMVIPIGSLFFQTLILITKDKQGQVKSKNLLDVRFVEMKGEYGWFSGDDE